MAERTIVKCIYCDVPVNKEQDEYIKTNSGYAHQSCYDEKQKKKKKLEEKREYKRKIHEKISSVCGDSYIKTKVDRQIKSFVEDGLKETGIYNTLVYWYDIKHNSPANAAGGIGIVPYVYNEAADYWRKNELKKQVNDKITEEDVKKVKENLDNYDRASVKKGPIRRPKRIVYFNLD